MISVKHEKMQDGSTKLKVVSPFNGEFVKFARQLNGSFNRTSSAWYFDVRDEERIRAALVKIYGTDGETATEFGYSACHGTLEH